MGVWRRLRDLIRSWYTPAMASASETTKRLRALEHEVRTLRRDLHHLTRLVEALLHPPRPVGSIALTPGTPFPTPSEEP